MQTIEEKGAYVVGEGRNYHKLNDLKAEIDGQPHLKFMENRIIKFRAWDKKENVMFAVYNITFKEDGTIISIPIFPKTEPDSILMQFTGLKDKNGKEIYEGDIITGEVELSNFKSIVEFKNGSFTVNEEWTGLKVIGNIYENPELLNK